MTYDNSHTDRRRYGNREDQQCGSWRNVDDGDTQTRKFCTRPYHPGGRLHYTADKQWWWLTDSEASTTATNPPVNPAYRAMLGLNPTSTPVDVTGRVDQAEPTRLAIVMVDDRHTDTTAHPFTTLTAALEYAAAAADRLGLTQQDQQHRPPGWLYYATHPFEDDAVWVVTRTLDRPQEDL